MKIRQVILGRALLLLLLTGCHSGPGLFGARQRRDSRSSASARYSIEGEWRFVYMNKPLMLMDYDVSPPPSFDAITFNTDGTVRLVNTLAQDDIVGTYTRSGNRVEWTFIPPNATDPVVHELVFSWTELGRALVLRPADGSEGIPTDLEWAYYRPERLLPADELIGIWTTSSQGRSTDITFKEDGRFYFHGRETRGYYRLWRSNQGNTLTTPIFVQGRGRIIIQYLYRIEGDRLILTPTGHAGPDSEGVIAWQRGET